jgi:sterol desaturase/sphingolipid hydroxylase (fatty acid hydroxylase superfamily)
MLSPVEAQLIIVSGLLAMFALIELVRGGFFPREAGAEDNRLDIAVMVMFPIVSGGVGLAAAALCDAFIPQYQGALAHWPWWVMIATLLVSDDLTQYLWHRLSHTSVMWPLHRAHHSAAYMSVRVVYRNNALYYMFMPGLWLSGLLVYLGFGWVYVGYIFVKLAVIIGAHCSWRWDEALYRIPALRPLMWVVERTISTPATHYAHHALSESDGIGHYSGNFGNLLFLWDVLFGTARITRRYPPAYGLADDRRFGTEKWYVQIFYPFLRSHRQSSTLVVPPGRPPA